MNTVGRQAAKIVDWLNGLTPWQKIAIIMGFALLLRIYIIINAATISVDSATDLGFAKAFIEGRLSEAIDPRRPPLHPLLVSLLYPLTGELELSARIVSLIFGILIIPLGFWLGRYIYDERTGLWTAFFITLHPYLIRYSGETLRETIYYFLAMAMVGLAMKAIMEKKAHLMVLVGVLSALAYLNKHAALGFLIIFTIWIALRNIKGIKEDWQRRLLLIGCGWLIFVLVALFYLIFLYDETGRVTLTAKVVPYYILLDMLHTLTLRNTNIEVFLSRFPEALSVPFVFFFGWYLVARRKEGFSEKEKFLLFVVAVYTVVHMLILPERRYFVRLTPFIAVFVAWGFERFTGLADSRFRERGALWVGTALVLIVVVQLYQGLTSLHAHRLPERLAGEWLLKEAGSGRTILARRPIVSFYAEGRFVYLRDELSIEELLKYARENRAEFLAGYRKNLERVVRGFKDREKGRTFLKELATFSVEEGRTYVIYRIVYHDEKQALLFHPLSLYIRIV